MPETERYGDHLFAHARSGEAERLAALAAALDRSTFQWLERLPLHKNARCLDIGTGLGTVAAWLAGRCPDGRVVATDRNTGLLPPAAERTWEALGHDVTTGDFPEGSFDLIHVRWVFSHLPDREAVLAKVVRWLAPGGWILVQDLDRFPIASSPHMVYGKVSEAMCDAVTRLIGTDTAWARTFPAPLARVGLADLDAEVFVPATGGQAPMGRFWLRSAEQLESDLYEHFGVTGPEFTQMRALMNDPDFHDFSLASVATWGRRPS